MAAQEGDFCVTIPPPFLSYQMAFSDDVPPNIHWQSLSGAPTACVLPPSYLFSWFIIMLFLDILSFVSQSTAIRGVYMANDP